MDIEFLKTVNEVVTSYLGDWASVLGFVLTVVGFLVTILMVMGSRSTVNKLRKDIGHFNLAAECSSAMGLMEQIKVLQRGGHWALVFSQYSALRKVLISIMAPGAGLSDPERARVRGAFQTLCGMEKKIERAHAKDGKELDVASLTSLISDKCDDLQEVLSDVKNRIGR